MATNNRSKRKPKSGLHLSIQLAEMFRNMSSSLESYGLDAANFAILVLSVLNAKEGEDDRSIFESYLCNQEVTRDEMQTAIGQVLLTRAVKLHEKYLEENPEAVEADKEAQTQAQAKLMALYQLEESGESEEVDEEMLQEQLAEDRGPLGVGEMASDLHGYWHFIAPDGEKLDVPVNDEMDEVYSQLETIFKKYNIKELYPVHVVIAMFEANHTELKAFFRALDQSYFDAKRYFSSKHILSLGKIPQHLADFLHNYNVQVDVSKTCEILGRDKEMNKLWNVMQKKNMRNAIIIGDAGVGKTAIIKKLAYDIVSGNCPEKFKGYQLVSLDASAIVSGITYRGQAKERVASVMEFLLENRDVILIIEEMADVLDAGPLTGSDSDLADAVKPILFNNDIIVIGTISYEDYVFEFESDMKLARRFEKIVVHEPKAREVYPMIKRKVEALSKYHGVKISKAMVNHAVMTAGCFEFERSNPDKTLDLIDRAMVAAKNAGKSRITKKIIEGNYDINFKTWENMSEESRKETAYHETGHYVAGKASERLNSLKWCAVSIMPAEHYLGITVPDYDDTQVPSTTMEYYIDQIAYMLGGRVAEEMYTGTYTSGASSDLDHATQIAYSVVTCTGMTSSFRNRVHLSGAEYLMFSEKAANIIEEEVDSLISKGLARAKQILEDNRDIVDAIAEALLKNHIMSEVELDKVWQETVRKRSEKQE